MSIRLVVLLAFAAGVALSGAGGALAAATDDQALAVAVSGPGKITSSPSGIDCGDNTSDDCVQILPNGTTVTLTATPSAGATFTGWDSGDNVCTGTSTTCTFVMNQARAVTADFASGGGTTRTLSVSVAGNGAVTGPGINCGNGNTDCSEPYTQGTSVTLTESPASGATFTGWGGSCSGTSTACAIVMDASKSVSAGFSGGSAARALGVSVVGNGQVTGNGINCGNGNSDCAETFSSTQSVTLTAAPVGGATFTGWSGACSGTSLTCTVTMDASKNVTATFSGGSSTSRTLTVSVTGNGRVTGPGIDCGNGFTDCSETFSSTVSIALTETPGSGASFTGWGGACSGTATSCTVSMDASKTVTAGFTGASSTTSTLTVTVTGSGRVTGPGITCGGGSTDCSETYSSNTSVTLTAAPSTGASFLGWSGSCTGSATTCTVVMNTAKVVAASFGTATATKNLTVSVAGGGRVTGPGITCGGSSHDCTESFSTGASVTLLASPNSGAVFLGWGGACSGTATTCTVVMDAAKAVTASFSTPSGGGGGGTGALVARSLGSPLVVRSAVGWAVTLRFNVNQGANGLLRLIRNSSLINAFTFSPRAGDVLVGPFQLATPGAYRFALSLSNGRGQSFELTWNLCLTNGSGCGPFRPATALVRRGSVTFARTGGGFIIRIRFTATRAVATTVTAFRGRTRVSAGSFQFSRGPISVDVQVNRPGTHRIVLVARDAAGRRQTLSWTIALR